MVKAWVGIWPLSWMPGSYSGFLHEVHGVQDSSQGCMVTYACNSFIRSEYACTSVDIGTLASSFVLDSVHDCTTDGIGQAEAKLGFQHDEIFDLNDTYDKFDDNSLILL